MDLYGNSFTRYSLTSKYLVAEGRKCNKSNGATSMSRGNEEGIRFFCVFIWAMKRALYIIKKSDVEKEPLQKS